MLTKTFVSAGGVRRDTNVLIAVRMWRGLPGPGFGSRSARPDRREEAVQRGQRLLAQRQFQRAERAIELVERARTDDPRGDPGPRQQPGQGDVGRVLAQIGAELLVRLDGRPVLLEGVSGTTGLGPARGALGLLAQRPGEQAAVQRRPRDDAHAVLLRG